MSDLKIIVDNKNELFNRREIEAEVAAESVPSKEEVKEMITKQLKTESSGIKVKTILGKFGSKEFVIVAHIYPDKEAMDKVEQKTKQEVEAEKKAEEERKKAEEEAKKAEEEAKAAAEKPSEGNTETAAEESKDENKEGGSG